MDAIGRALALAGSMTWEILWALILGFALSAVVQAVVRKSAIVGLLGDDRPRTLAVATGLGAASSSCSYAAVALARSLFRKGANFTAASGEARGGNEMCGYGPLDSSLSGGFSEDGNQLTATEVWLLTLGSGKTATTTFRWSASRI